MPLPKGALLNKKTGRFEMPKGYQKKKDEERARERKPTTSSRQIETNFGKTRLAARQTFVYALYAVYPGSKAWVGYVEEPTHESIAQNYGGGRFEVWKIDRTTNDPIGDPAIFDIDRQQYPPLLDGFKQAVVPRLGAGAMPPGFQPGAWPGFGAQAPAVPADRVKIEELEEELEDAEEEIAGLKRRLDDKDREMRDDKDRHARDLDKIEADRKMEALIMKLSGDKKDPFDTYMAMKRVDAELAGPFKGAQDPMQMMQSQLQFFQMFQGIIDKAKGDGGNGGGIDALMKVLGSMAEAANKAPAQVIELPAAPVARPVPETVVTKSPEQVKAEQEAVELSKLELSALISVAEVCEGFFEFGMPEPQVIADFILNEKGRAFELFRETVKLDNPENAVEVIGQHRPKATDSEEKKRIIAQAFALAQAKLVEE